MDARKQCGSAVAARESCWEQNGGRDTENCFEEELNEKRCLSFVCCPREAKSFYTTPSGTKGECSLWAEYFAFPDDIRHRLTRDTVNQSPKKQQDCREITMNLAKCMAKYRQYIGWRWWQYKCKKNEICQRFVVPLLFKRIDWCNVMTILSADAWRKYPKEERKKEQYHHVIMTLRLTNAVNNEGMKKGTDHR